jgi:hypothetical protein
MDDRVAKLMLKAVRTLPQREQDQVFTALFKEALSEPASVTRPLPASDVFMVSGAEPFSIPRPIPGGPGMAVVPGQSAMLPVRLPPELHERLRRWSTEQGFSMAGVVRGLVERFLDEQSSAKPRKRAGARSRSKRTSATARG